MITKQKSKNQTMKKKNLGKNFNPQGKIKEKEKLTLFLGHKSKNFMFYNEIIAEVMAHWLGWPTGQAGRLVIGAFSALGTHIMFLMPNLL